MEDTILFDYTIIGVTRDFNFMSLHEEISAYLFVIRPGNSFPYIIVDTETTDYTGLLNQIEDKWKATLPGLPFEYLFLDSQMQKLYDGDRNFAQIIGTFTSIAIVICCLGLFGLSAFTAEQRIKEIGVRKVLGASVTEILLMLMNSTMPVKKTKHDVLTEEEMAQFRMRQHFLDTASTYAEQHGMERSDVRILDQGCGRGHVR